MTERHIPRGETEVTPLDLSAESEQNLSRIHKEGQEASNETVDLEEIMKSVEQNAVSGKERSSSEREDHQTTFIPGLQRDLKQNAYKRTLERTQSNLSTPERLLSKTIHHPVIDAISNVGSKTVARPSGILGGGLLALLGSLTLSYFSRYYGFRYNYLFFLMLFAAGFTIGLIIELLVRLVRGRR